MNDQLSINSIDSLLLQFALQTRELSQKKNELNQQIKVCRANIDERRSCIISISRNIKKLEEDIRAKQSSVIRNKANAKSMKVMNNLLLQYEQTLKAELESRRNSYNNDMELYEERIARYRKVFQSHEEYYYQNPLAQKLLMLQTEKEAIECRIKAHDEQITIKQKELDHWTGPAANLSTESLPDKEPEKQLDQHIEEDCESYIDVSSLHLNETKNGHKVSVEVNAGGIHEENKVQDNCAEEVSNELWPNEQLDEQAQPDEIHINEQDKETEIKDQVMEQQTTASGIEDPVEESVSLSVDQAPSKDNNEALTAFPQSASQETNQSPFPTRMTAAPPTQTFPFNFSPASSPHQGTSDGKSPAFLFSLNSDPSTPAFSGFGFDIGSSQDEDSSFTFPSSFFSDKKTTESKPSSCPGFLFAQPEQSEDFQFAFTSKSPTAANKDDSRDEFPFSFNF